MARRLEQGDLAQQAAAQRDAGSLLGGDQPAAYAPPDRAVTPPVAADTSAVLPQQPGPALNPDEAKAGVSSGDYNVLDAQTNLGFKPTPGYMQDAIAAKEKDPEMQAYYGQLSAKEAKNAQDVSPTGAAGPFQITRGTGRSLGMTPDQRFDPAASTDAVRNADGAERRGVREGQRPAADVPGAGADAPAGRHDRRQDGRRHRQCAARQPRRQQHPARGLAGARRSPASIVITACPTRLRRSARAMRSHPSWYSSHRRKARQRRRQGLLEGPCQTLRWREQARRSQLP